MKVGWDQVHAWRLRRQLVDPRGNSDAVDVVTRLCGVQAQVASSAKLAVKLRQTKPVDGAVERALHDGVLLKVWAMRGTLHLLRTADAGAYLSVMASVRSWEKPSWQKASGVTPQEIDALADVVSELLDGTVLSRDELVTKIAAKQRFAAMEQHLRSGWGSLLKPLAWRGVLCHGPNQGTRVTFVRPTSLPEWTGLPDPDEAAPRVIAAYLGAFGPATPEAFDAWLFRGGLKKATLRGWFASLGDRLTEVDVEGRAGFILTEHADELAETKPTASVRLLGPFDQYVLGPSTREPELLPPEYRDKVSKAAGWISPIVVVGGRITGVWELTDSQVTVSFFPGEATASTKDLEAEVAHVARAGGRSDLTLEMASAEH